MYKRKEVNFNFISIWVPSLFTQHDHVHFCHSSMDLLTRVPRPLHLIICLVCIVQLAFDNPW